MSLFQLPSPHSRVPYASHRGFKESTDSESCNESTKLPSETPREPVIKPIRLPDVAPFVLCPSPLSGHSELTFGDLKTSGNGEEGEDPLRYDLQRSRLHNRDRKRVSRKTRVRRKLPGQRTKEALRRKKEGFSSIIGYLRAKGEDQVHKSKQAKIFKAGSKWRQLSFLYQQKEFVEATYNSRIFQKYGYKC